MSFAVFKFRLIRLGSVLGRFFTSQRFIKPEQLITRRLYEQTSLKTFNALHGSFGMKMLANLTAIPAALVIASVPLLPHVHAQEYPTKPIRLIVPFVAGGNLDVVTRPLAQKLTQSFGQQVIVDNRPGASGIIGTQAVAKSPPDGYTYLMSATILVTTPTIMATVPSYDPIRDFSGVSTIALIPQILVVHPSLPVKNVKELIALAKARPGELNYASGGTGSSSHLATELFTRQANIRLTRIPYKSSGPALVDLLGGNVSLMFDNISTSLSHINAGRLKVLAVTSTNRSPLLPNVPTTGETLPGYVAVQFNGMFAPARTPREIISRMHAEIVRFVEMPDMKTLYSRQGVALVSSSSPEQFNEFVRAEYTRWTKVIQDAGIKSD